MTHSGIQAVIIDDESRSVSTLQKLIQHFHPDVSVAGVAFSGAEGMQLVREKIPDLVFLDIQMADMTGFDLLEQLKEISFDVIFTTAYDQYAVKAFRFAAIDYLLKPIDIDELNIALKRFRDKKNLPGDTDARRQSFDVMRSALKPGEIQKISLPTMEGMIFVDIPDIVYLQSTSNYTSFIISGRRSYMVSKSIGEYEELLSAHHFYRVHNRYIINLSLIERYVKGDGGFIIMKDGTEIEVSRRKKDDFLAKLGAVTVKSRQ